MTSFDRTERRILGVLIEKALTTPDQYPLTAKAIVAGCNQKSNRSPVMELEEWEADGALRSLLIKEWVREVHRAGGRSARYGERLSERLGLDAPQRAVLAELMLRGPSTVGEIRMRSSRMHRLDSIEETLAILRTLADEPHVLVHALPRRSGEREERWQHLLLPAEEAQQEPEPESPPAAPAARAAAHQGELLERLERLESTVSRLDASVTQIARTLGIELEAENISESRGDR